MNNIPHKICTYSCVYCQVGKAIKIQVDRQEFYKPEELVDETRTALYKIQNGNEYPDYITIVSDGEPALDKNLGDLIDQLKAFKIPVAVITNGSLIQYTDVREDLLKADYVSVKCDTFVYDTWRRINRPHKNLKLDEIIAGIRSFAMQYTGKFVTETMLIKGYNDSPYQIKLTSCVIETFDPAIAYIAIPTRPPAFKEVISADETTLNESYQIFKGHVRKVELLTGYEGNAFSSTGNFRDDLLSITAVHPMREDAVLELLQKTKTGPGILTGLLEEKTIKQVDYNGHLYYMRKFI